MKIETPVEADGLDGSGGRELLAEYAKRINMHDGLVRALTDLADSVHSGSHESVSRALAAADTALALAGVPAPTLVIYCRELPADARHDRITRTPSHLLALAWIDGGYVVTPDPRAAP